MGVRGLTLCPTCSPRSCQPGGLWRGREPWCHTCEQLLMSNEEKMLAVMLLCFTIGQPLWVKSSEVMGLTDYLKIITMLRSLNSTDALTSPSWWRGRQPSSWLPSFLQSSIPCFYRQPYFWNQKQVRSSLVREVNLHSITRYTIVVNMWSP